MIFQKGDMWKISGRPKKYATFAEAEAALAKFNAQEVAAKKAESLEIEKNLQKELLAEEERLKKLTQLAEDSTPYEKMIAKNICIICNLEPCECFTYTQKMEVGE